MDSERDAERIAEEYPSPHPLMSEWRDLLVEHNPVGVLTMSGYFRDVKYEESLHLTNFEMAAAEQKNSDAIEKVIMRLMRKLENKPNGN